MFKDEKGNWSAARLFIAVWTVLVGVALFQGAPEAFWATSTAVLIGLVSWAAGPRVAEYIGGQIAGAAGAVANKLGGKDAKTSNSITGGTLGDNRGSAGGSGGGKISP